ncbi:PAS domain-containing protein [Pelagibius sp. 7325]|uniref:PAS domain-containing protein n=1 Tax=Pelagibius sp. 7325 TaxID=3131994 RepID=UPI0030EE1AD7
MAKGLSVLRNLAITRIYGVNEETVTEATAFLSSKVAGLYRWWHSHAAEGRLPLRREFDITEHTPIVPDLFLVEVLADGQFLMKLEGERVIELFGVNNTGRIITEAAGVGEYGHALAEYYQSIADERQCRRCTGNMEHLNHRRWIEFESIDCPLSRDGRQVDFILGVSVSVRENRL